MEQFGAWSLVPAIVMTILIFTTKRVLEGMVISSLLALIMVHKGDFFWAFMEAAIKVGTDEQTIWLWIVCGLMGSIIALIDRTGGAIAFGQWVAERAKTRKATLMATWFLGIIIFIDDYLNSLTIGSCMTPVTDKHRVSREYLAYIVDSTAAPVCVLLPISTWAVFAAELFEKNGWAPDGQGMAYFIQTIPYNFYAWVALFIVPLIILGIIPLFGPMKAAERRAHLTGVLAPEGSEKIDMKAGEIKLAHPKRPKVRNFFLPIIVLIVATVVMGSEIVDGKFNIGADMLAGVLITLAFMVALYLPQKILTGEEFSDVTIMGLKNMIYPLLLMYFAFLFAETNEQIGFTEYIIHSAKSVMTPELLPAVVFLILAAQQFITGTNWGMYIIALPVVIPLAMGVGANMPLTIAALLSAGVFGSHVCFFADATILTSAATGCDNYRHSITQMPFGLLAALISLILFVIFGYIL